MKERNDMNNDFNEIINLFKKINERGYIKGKNNNLLNSCGLTFESLLNKKADSMFFPDYKNIEIKCKQRYSRYDISLFTISFDGPYLFESNYLLETYGIENTKYNNQKELFINFKFKEKVLVGNFYFELDLNYKEEMVVINIYDLELNFIEKRGFIYFKSLEERIRIKLNKLVLVYAGKKKIYQHLYFRYYKIVCLNYKGFNKLLELIEKDIIKITLMSRFSKSINALGKTKNKNMIFKISDKNICELYSKEYEYEN